MPSEMPISFPPDSFLSFGYINLDPKNPKYQGPPAGATQSSAFWEVDDFFLPDTSTTTEVALSPSSGSVANEEPSATKYQGPPAGTTQSSTSFELDDLFVPTTTKPLSPSSAIFGLNKPCSPSSSTGGPTEEHHQGPPAQSSASLELDDLFPATTAKTSLSPNSAIFGPNNELAASPLSLSRDLPSGPVPLHSKENRTSLSLSIPSTFVLPPFRRAVSIVGKHEGFHFVKPDLDDKDAFSDIRDPLKIPLDFGASNKGGTNADDLVSQLSSSLNLASSGLNLMGSDVEFITKAQDYANVRVKDEHEEKQEHEVYLDPFSWNFNQNMQCGDLGKPGTVNFTGSSSSSPGAAEEPVKSQIVHHKPQAVLFTKPLQSTKVTNRKGQRGRARRSEAPVQIDEITNINISLKALSDEPSDLYNDDVPTTIGRYTKSVRRGKIEKYKRKMANPNNKVLYECRKQFADERPRVGGRFVKM